MVLVHDDARELALLVRRVQPVGVVDGLVSFIRFRALVGPRQLLDLGPGLPPTSPAEVARGAGGRHDGCPGGVVDVRCVFAGRVTRRRPSAAPVQPRCVMRCVCAGLSRAARALASGPRESVIVSESAAVQESLRRHDTDGTRPWGCLSSLRPPLDGMDV